MCRLTALITRGEPMLLADILTRPRRSIIQQSFNCQERLPTSDIRNAYQKASLNGDGFGVGWYAGGSEGEGSKECGGGPWLPGLDATCVQTSQPEETTHSQEAQRGRKCLGGDAEACVFTSLKPAWADRNLYNLAEKISSRLFFAHVRAASSTLVAPACCGGCEGEEGTLPSWATASGGVSTELCCHPFQCGRFLFMHNGSVGGFAQIRRSLLQLLPDAIFTYAITNSCIDSVCLFALFLALLPGGPFAPASPLQIKTAIEGMIQCICFYLAREKILEPTVINVVVSDGCCVVATRFVTDYREVESSTYKPNANASKPRSGETPDQTRGSEASSAAVEGFVFRGPQPPLTLEGPPVSQPASLYFATGTAWRSVPGDPSEYRMIHRDKRSDVCIITSEPLTSNPEEWLPVPRNTMLLVTPAIDLLLYPIAGVPSIPRRLLQQRNLQRTQTLGSLPPPIRQPQNALSAREALSLTQRLWNEVAKCVASQFEAKFEAACRRLTSSLQGSAFAVPASASSAAVLGGAASLAALHALREVLMEGRQASLKRLEDSQGSSAPTTPHAKDAEGFPSDDISATSSAGEGGAGADGWAALERKVEQRLLQRASLSEGREREVLGMKPSAEESTGAGEADASPARFKSLFEKAPLRGDSGGACNEACDLPSTPSLSLGSRLFGKPEPQDAPRGYEVQTGEGAILCVEALTISVQDGAATAASHSASVSKTFVFAGTERGDVFLYEGSRASACPVVFQAHEGSVLTLAVYVEPQGSGNVSSGMASQRGPSAASLSPPPCRRCGGSLPEVFLITGSCDTSVAVWSITPLLLGGPSPELRRCGLASPSTRVGRRAFTRAPSLGSLPLRICSQDLLALRLRLSPHQGDVLSLLVINADADADAAAIAVGPDGEKQVRLRGCAVDSATRSCSLFVCEECKPRVHFALKFSDQSLVGSGRSAMNPPAASGEASLAEGAHLSPLSGRSREEEAAEKGCGVTEAESAADVVGEEGVVEESARMDAWKSGPLLLMGFQSAKIGCVPVKSLVGCFRHSQLLLSVLASAVELQRQPSCGTRDFELKALVSGQLQLSRTSTANDVCCSPRRAPAEALSPAEAQASASSEGSVHPLPATLPCPSLTPPKTLSPPKTTAEVGEALTAERTSAIATAEEEERASLSVLLSQCASSLRNVVLQGHLAGASLCTRLRQGAWRCLYAPSGTVYSYEMPQEVELPLPQGASASPSPGVFRVVASASKIRVYANPTPPTDGPSIELRFLPLTQEPPPLCPSLGNSPPLQGRGPSSFAFRSAPSEAFFAAEGNSQPATSPGALLHPAKSPEVSSPLRQMRPSCVSGGTASAASGEGALRSASPSNSPAKTGTAAPDGAFLASCLGGAWMDKIGHNGFVECLVACGGPWLCSGGGDGRVLLWQGAMRLAAEMKGHSGGVLCLAYCRKKKGASTTSADSPPSLSASLISNATCSSVLARRGSSRVSAASSVGSVASEFLGGRLFNAAANRNEDGESDSRCGTPPPPPDGLLFSGGRDCSIRVWLLEQQVCMHSLRLHQSDVLALAADCDGGILVSGSADGELLVWSTERLTALFRLHVKESLDPWNGLVSQPQRGPSQLQQQQQPVSFTATVLVFLRDDCEDAEETPSRAAPEEEAEAQRPLERKPSAAEGNGLQIWAARGDGRLSVWELRAIVDESPEAPDGAPPEVPDPLEVFLEAADSQEAADNSAPSSREPTGAAASEADEAEPPPDLPSTTAPEEGPLLQPHFRKEQQQPSLRLKAASSLSALPSVCFEGSALSHQRGFLQLLQQFVAFPSVSGSLRPLHIKGCFDAAAFASRLLERALGAEVALVHPTNTLPLAARESAFLGEKPDFKAATRGPPTSNPVVFARLGGNPDKPTVVFYSHYDVVPAEPPASPASGTSASFVGDAGGGSPCSRMEGVGLHGAGVSSAMTGWLSDPWTVQCRDGYFYGRGVSDNKGPLLCSLLAVKHFIRRFRSRSRVKYQTEPERSDSGGKLPFNFVWISEGEEENGSRGFEAAVEEKASWLKGAEFLICTNSYWADDSTPCLVHGMRGVLDVELFVSGSRLESHSGLDGGTAHEPMKDLVRLLGSLFGPSGEFSVPGFFDDVCTPDPSELSRLDEAAECLAGQRGYDVDFEETKRLLRKRWLQPSVSILSVRGLTPSAAESRVIPGGASATLSIRLVPNQRPVAVFRLIRDFLHSQFEILHSPNALRVSLLRGGSPWGAPLKAPRTERLFSVASHAIKKVWGVEPLFVREGGSMPALPFLMETMQSSAGHTRNGPRAHPPSEVAVCQLPFGQASDNAHLSNERIGMRQVERGVAVLVEMLEGLAQNLTF